MSSSGVVSNYKITKSESYSQLVRALQRGMAVVSNYKITKLQNLKAIHNDISEFIARAAVVSNYKITKSESYSQRWQGGGHVGRCCI